MKEKYGRWEVIEKTGRKWLCRCDCGSVRPVERHDLKRGASQSCGCFHRDRASEANTTHGFTTEGNGVKSRFFHTWARMIERCNSKGSKDYAYYGGRGIGVCDQWATFEGFRDDMWASYQDAGSTTLERINVNGNYEPQNCVWASRLDQANNKRNNRVITLYEKTQTLAQWAAFLGVPRERIRDRLRLGWNIEDALLEPVRT